MITPDAAVDAMQARFGVHPGYRALHAKGILCRGTFTARPEAGALSRAAHLTGTPVEATVRFSNGSGDPRSPDHEPDVRGMAVKLYLPDGARTDVVAQTAPRFPARTPDAFVEFVRAMEPGVGVAWRLPLFLARHPEALPGLRANLDTLKPPASFAALRFHAIHAYRWVAADGAVRHVRYHWAPEAALAPLGRGEAKGRGPDYLFEELRARLGRAPVRFALELELAEPGDPVDDPTAAWGDRETVVAGTLEVTGLDTVRERDGDVLVFDPTRVTDGIELTDDPVLHFRRDAYSASIERRSGVARAPD